MNLLGLLPPLRNEGLIGNFVGVIVDRGEPTECVCFGCPLFNGKDIINTIGTIRHGITSIGFEDFSDGTPMAKDDVPEKMWLLAQLVAY